MRAPGEMADPTGLQIINLRDLNPVALEPLLAEQTAEWAAELDWDHSQAENLIRSLSGARRLAGLGLLDQNEAAGYGYVGLEGNKGLIADVYVRPRWRAGAEATLLRAVFDFLTAMPAVTRIEGQLMMVADASAKALERGRPVKIFERVLMQLDSASALPAAIATRYRIEPWRDDRIAPAAEIIEAAYGGQVDAQIHDRYSTVAGAEVFLRELVQFPGASFRPSASYVAFDPATGSAAGLSLASFVAAGVGHIAEICVSPHARGSGLGRDLLRRSIEALCAAGAKRVSLAVTVSNEPALRLYRRFGFRERRSFHAYVWKRA